MWKFFHEVMKLKDIAEYVTGKVSSEAIQLEAYVTTDSLLQNKAGRVLASNLPPEKCILTKFQPGDVLVANIRPYLKKIWRADCEGGCNADVLAFRAKEGHCSEFLYAVLMQDAFFAYAMKGSKGSKMPRGDKSQMLRYEIPMLSSSQEKNIGKFMTNIDSKVALNREINRNLEAMARQLYDYWFVQFDFPDENGRPYKSSGGKMVWNEKLKREIPEGWYDTKLSKIANITMGQSPDGSSYNEQGNGILFYQGSTDFGMRFPSIRLFTTSPTRFAKEGDILMSVRAPVGATNIANADCCIGRGLAAMNSKLGSITHLYHIIQDLKTAFDLRNDAGTTFGSITKDDLYNLVVLKPTKSILELYENICNPIFKQQMLVGRNIVHLIKQRDELLPLLMNGQVNCDLSPD